jgi:predicted Zn-dependent protease with MMP-like domain
MLEFSDQEFDDAVSDALDLIPPDLADRIDNVVVLVEDEPPADQPDDLLGLYEGIPLTERGDFSGGFVVPDRITLFRNPLRAFCDTREDLVDEIAVTVVHEIAHYFGISDERLHEFGWG